MVEGGAFWHPLYPAMPYTSYHLVTRDDLDALYAYFMSLKPVDAPAKRQRARLSLRHPAAPAGLEPPLPRPRPPSAPIRRRATCGIAAPISPRPRLIAASATRRAAASARCWRRCSRRRGDRRHGRARHPSGHAQGGRLDARGPRHLLSDRRRAERLRLRRDVRRHQGFASPSHRRRPDGARRLPPRRARRRARQGRGGGGRRSAERRRRQGRGRLPDLLRSLPRRGGAGRARMSSRRFAAARRSPSRTGSISSARSPAGSARKG